MEAVQQRPNTPPPTTQKELNDDDLDAILESAIDDMTFESQPSSTEMVSEEKKSESADHVTPEMEDLERQMSELLGGISPNAGFEEVMGAVMSKFQADPQSIADFMKAIPQDQLDLMDPLSQTIRAAQATYKKDENLCRGLLAQMCIPGEALGLTGAGSMYLFSENLVVLQEALMQEAQSAISRGEDEFSKVTIEDICRKTGAEQLTESEAIVRLGRVFKLERAPIPQNGVREMLERLGVKEDPFLEAMERDIHIETEMLLAAVGACVKKPDFQAPLVEALRQVQVQVMQLGQSGMSQENIQRHIKMMHEPIYSKAFGALWGSFQEAKCECLVAQYRKRMG